MKSYEIIEHTADIGLRIYGRDLKELFSRAAEGLFDLITDFEGLKKSAANEKFALRLKCDNAEELLFKWLNELLFVFSTKRLVAIKVNFSRLTKKELESEIVAVQFDPSRDEQRYEVKAVTRHQFKVEKKKDGWVAEVIFDI